MLNRCLIAIAMTAMGTPAAAQTTTVKREVIEKAATLIEARYVDPKAGKRIADVLRRQAATLLAGATPDAFARSFTAHLRNLSNDAHFALEYDPTSNPAAEGDMVDPAELDRWYGARVNHGFEQVARLENGIGYLDLRVFAPTSMAADLASAAMSLLAQSPALIIDLRNNGGGMDDMTRLLAAYLLDERREMSASYDRPSNRMERHFTLSEVPGRRFGGKKPVYILVSHRTFSAAEAFAYDLQAMKRAIIIGEQTGGGAHPFAYRPVGHDFILSLPEGRSINPVTGRDWEGVGVTPDIPAPVDAALKRAILEARNATLIPYIKSREGR